MNAVSITGGTIWLAAVFSDPLQIQRDGKVDELGGTSVVGVLSSKVFAHSVDHIAADEANTPQGLLDPAGDGAREAVWPWS